MKHATKENLTAFDIHVARLLASVTRPACGFNLAGLSDGNLHQLAEEVHNKVVQWLDGKPPQDPKQPYARYYASYKGIANFDGLVGYFRAQREKQRARLAKFLNDINTALAGGQ